MFCCHFEASFRRREKEQTDKEKGVVWHSLSEMEAIVLTVKSTWLFPFIRARFYCFPRMLSQVCKPCIWDGRKDKLVSRLVEKKQTYRLASMYGGIQVGKDRMNSWSGNDYG
jgi:hypothetical protein